MGIGAVQEKVKLIPLSCVLAAGVITTTSAYMKLHMTADVLVKGHKSRSPRQVRGLH